MALSPFMAAINQIADEKGLKPEVVLETVESAIAAAYRKDYGYPHQILKARINLDDFSKTKIFQVFHVVKKGEFEDEHTQVLLAQAKKIKKGAKTGEEIFIELPFHEEFGRIAAQTAKQVIIQRLREAERDMLYNEYKGKEGQLLNGTVQQIENRDVIINLGKINALMLPSGQVPTERYYIGQRLKVYIAGVEESNRGPRVLVSRSDPRLISGLFSLEVPEIAMGTVEIKAIAREPGSRTKIAVASNQEGLDPIGSCVGQRGIRVQAVLAEIGEEKIDIVLWDKDPEQHIIKALSPAKVSKVKIDKKNKTARVSVPEDQLSLAIGRGGQNVRLASKLTGWVIDIEKKPEKPKAKKAESSE